MKTKVLFRCDECSRVRRIDFELGKPIPTGLQCPCHKGTLSRVFGDVSTEIADENASKATQIILNGKLPSGRDKAVF